MAFIDIDPASSTFHEIVKTTAVGTSPAGIAWETGNEDVLVCNEGDSTVSVVSAFSLEVRKVLTKDLNAPFDVATTQRQTNFGFFRNVYFAYFLQRNETVAMFESGPNGVNGWGFDDVLAVLPYRVCVPKSIHADPADLRSGFWTTHQAPINVLSGQPGDIGEGAVTRWAIVSGIPGQLPLNVSDVIPNLRDLVVEPLFSVGEAELTGCPVHLAFDDQANLGALQNVANAFSAGAPASVNGKSSVREINGGPFNTNEPQHVFVAVPETGSVDVFSYNGPFSRVDTNPFQPGTQSIPASGVSRLGSYFGR